MQDGVNPQVTDAVTQAAGKVGGYSEQDLEAIASQLAKAMEVVQAHLARRRHAKMVGKDVDVLSNNELAQTIADLKGTIQAFMKA